MSIARSCISIRKNVNQKCNVNGVLRRSSVFKTARTMSTVKLLLISMLQLHLCGFCQRSPLFLSVPKSAIVKIHANVSLECVVNSTNPVLWGFINTVSHPTEEPIYSYREIVEQMKSRYRINNQRSGQHNLVIDSVNHKHAGRYICEEFFSNSKATAELTVIDSDPVCKMNVTNMTNGQTIWLWCGINSTGFLIPQMKWTKGNGALINSTTQNTTIDELTTTTTSFVRLQLHPQDNNAIERTTIKCTTSFMSKNGAAVPYYEHVWKHILTSENKPTVAEERKIITETISILFTGTTEATSDSIPPQLGIWIMAAFGGSIVIMILIILCVVLQCRKKKKKGNTPSTALPLNAGSSGNTENTKREAEGKRLPKTQRKEIEHGTENVEAYETFANRPTTSMQSDTYCELQDKPISIPPTSAVLEDERQIYQTIDDKYQTIDDKYQTIEAYETLANRPSAAVPSETYCELNLLKEDKPNSKPLTSAVLEDERQEYQTIVDEYQTIVDYETLANRPSPAVQPETYCELQIANKKKDKKK